MPNVHLHFLNSVNQKQKLLKWHGPLLPECVVVVVVVVVVDDDDVVVVVVVVDVVVIVVIVVFLFFLNSSAEAKFLPPLPRLRYKDSDYDFVTRGLRVSSVH